MRAFGEVLVENRKRKGYSQAENSKNTASDIQNISVGVVRAVNQLIVHFDENMLIGDAADLDAFMEMYGVEAISGIIKMR